MDKSKLYFISDLLLTVLVFYTICSLVSSLTVGLLSSVLIVFLIVRPLLKKLFKIEFK